MGYTEHLPSGKFSAIAVIDGKRHRVGSFDTEVEAKARILVIEDSGEAPEKPNNIGFLAFANHWLETGSQNKKTKQSYRSIIDVHFAHSEVLKYRRMRNVKTSDVLMFIKELEAKTREVGSEKRHYSTALITNCLARLSAICALAVNDGILKNGNPVEKIDRRYRPTGKAKKIHICSPEEIAKLLQVAREYGPRWSTMLALARFAGLRKTEILDLTWDRVDFERHVIIVSGDVKTEASEGTVAMDKLLSSLLAEWKLESTHSGDSDYVIASNRGGRTGDRNASRAMEVIRERSGIDVTLHPLRHNLASNLIFDNVGDKVLSMQMRHKNSSITRQIYEHYFKAAEDRTEAIASVDRFTDEMLRVDPSLRPGS